MYLDLLIQKNLDFLEDIFVLNINIYICYLSYLYGLNL